MDAHLVARDIKMLNTTPSGKEPLNLTPLTPTISKIYRSHKSNTNRLQMAWNALPKTFYTKLDLDFFHTFRKRYFLHKKQFFYFLQ